MVPQRNYKSTYMENKKYDGMFLGFSYRQKYLIYILWQKLEYFNGLYLKIRVIYKI